MNAKKRRLDRRLMSWDPAHEKEKADQISRHAAWISGSADTSRLFLIDYKLIKEILKEKKEPARPSPRDPIMEKKIAVGHQARERKRCPTAIFFFHDLGFLVHGSLLSLAPFFFTSNLPEIQTKERCSRGTSRWIQTMNRWKPLWAIHRLVCPAASRMDEADLTFLSREQASSSRRTSRPALKKSWKRSSSFSSLFSSNLYKRRSLSWRFLEWCCRARS